MSVKEEKFTFEIFHPDGFKLLVYLVMKMIEKEIIIVVAKQFENSWTILEPLEDLINGIPPIEDLLQSELVKFLDIAIQHQLETTIQVEFLEYTLKKGGGRFEVIVSPSISHVEIGNYHHLV